MNLEDQVRETILAELGRQCEDAEGALKVQPDGEDGLTIEGRIDLAALSMAVVGHLAGGP